VPTEKGDPAIGLVKPALVETSKKYSIGAAFPPVAEAGHVTVKLEPVIAEFTEAVGATGQVIALLDNGVELL
jgi:hypothetical protein